MLNRALREAELLILNAPFEERGWERAVQGVADSTGSHAAQLLGIGGPLFLSLNVFVGAPASYRHYIHSAMLHGPCNYRVGSTTVPMAIQHEEHYDAYRAANATADYDDAASEMDIQFGCQSALLLDQHSMIGLALLRGRRDGRCDSEVLDRFAHLRHHMARAVSTQIALDGEASELMVGDMEALQGATFLLDRLACLAALTPAAEQMLEQERAIRLNGLTIELVDRKDDRRFQRLLARSLEGPEGGVHEMRFGRDGQGRPGAWRLFVLRLPHRAHGLGFEPELALTVKPAR